MTELSQRMWGVHNHADCASVHWCTSYQGNGNYLSMRVTGGQPTTGSSAGGFRHPAEWTCIPLQLFRSRAAR
jgi:hypothetical protein